ncbi:hypothetical protein AB0I55_01370 [Actinocatenispora sera]|uniref:N-acyl-D-amino-acid deacylase family protein n=1 Tax=Actinocatenispora sera TaxID=390989 RepID=UPI00340FD0C3
MSDHELVIRGGLVFDGAGSDPVRADLGVTADRITAISPVPLPPAPRELDGTGRWVLPGLLDVHTHYDAEVLVEPGLGESVRHGVTTVLIGNCSLSTVYADAQDCADLFARVEAVPWEAVHDAVKRHRDWADPASYLAALGARPLGANVAALIGHSDLRVAVLGLARAVEATQRPSGAELAAMREKLTAALDAGFAGLSTIRSSFSKLDGVRYPARQLPSTYATWREYGALNAILRDRGRVLQCTPNLTRRAEVARFFAQSAGLLHRTPLHTSLLSAADIKANPGLIRLLTAATRAANRLGRCDVRWQHLPVPFEVYADGVDLVVFEEFGSGAAALNVRDEIARGRLLADEDYRRWFRRDCAKRFGARVWHRDLSDAEIVGCPDDSVVGLSFADVGARRRIAATDAFLDLVVAHGPALRWRTTIANHRPAVLDRIARSPQIQLGFADSGAHLRNMAFYNHGLRLLQRVYRAQRSGAPFLSLPAAVHRLTGELGDWYGIDAGHLRVGGRADVAVLDPAGVADLPQEYHEEPMPAFGGLRRMVNRNDDAVAATVVGGRVVYEYGRFAEGFGTTLRAGRVLPASRGVAPRPPRPGRGTGGITG